MTTVPIDLDKIVIDAGTQARTTITIDTVNEYSEALEAGDKFPPVDVFNDGTTYSTYWLADGFHRYHAHKQVGRPTISATIHKGTLRDAILFAVKANHAHGVRRSNDDKRHCIQMLLNDKQWARRSDRWIAEQCHVSHTLVSGVRKTAPKDSTGNIASSKTINRTGRDGKVRKARPAKPKARPPQNLPAEVEDEQEAKPDEQTSPNEDKERELVNLLANMRTWSKRTDNKIKELAGGVVLGGYDYAVAFRSIYVLAQSLNDLAINDMAAAGQEDLRKEQATLMTTLKQQNESLAQMTEKLHSLK